MSRVAAGVDRERVRRRLTLLPAMSVTVAAFWIVRDVWRIEAASSVPPEIVAEPVPLTAPTLAAPPDWLYVPWLTAPAEVRLPATETVPVLARPWPLSVTA